MPRTQSVLALFARRSVDTEIEETIGNETGKPITINILELIGIMMSAFVMPMTENDRPEYAGDTVLLRGDNVSAVSWLNRCGDARDKRAALVMRIMRRLEVTSGWSHKAKHIPGILNVIADGIPRRQPDQIAEKLRSHVNEGDWRQVPLGQNSLEFLSILLQPAFSKESVDERL